MKKKLPPLGLRIIKSSFGVLCGFLIYYLRGCQGTPFYTALAVMWCMRPTIKTSKQMALQRTIGTFIGGIYGLLILIIVIHYQLNMFINLMLSSLMIIPIIYTTLLIKKKNASYFACVVFLSIVVNHVADSQPYLFVFNRVLDTLIGIILGLIINSLQLPRHKNKDILFVSGIDDVLVNNSHKMSDYSIRKINVMIENGMLFTVSSMRTVPIILDSIPGINLKLPIIAMDGAVLFDVHEKKYLKTYKMNHKDAQQLISFIKNQGFHVFINCIFEDSWIIHYGNFNNEAEEAIFHKLRKNPYRNYFKHDLFSDQNPIYLMLIDKHDKIHKLYQQLQKNLDLTPFKIIIFDSQEYSDYTYMKIYDHQATRENMLKELMNLYHIDQTITFGSIENKYDVVVDGTNANIVAKTLDKLYQPLIIKQKGPIKNSF